jgi:hypothetical protein
MHVLNIVKDVVCYIVCYVTVVCNVWDSKWARKSRVCSAHARWDECGSLYPVWMHVLKHGKVVDEIAEQSLRSLFAWAS